MSSWMFDTLLYTGLLIALVLVLRRPVGRWFGPQTAYALWALPLVRLVLPPIVLPAAFKPAEAAPEPLETTLAAVPAVPVELGAQWAAAAAADWQWGDLAALAVPVWLAGALTFLIWRVATYRGMRRLLLAEARPVGEAGGIRLVETPELATPVAFGVFDKVIALPRRFMVGPDIAARDLAIAHELQHHRGHDLLANYAAQVLLALHWFNPIAWLGWRAMRRDQEAACDARVMAGRGREERAIYAALIANIAAGPRLALVAPMACPVLGERSIVHRLKTLSKGETAPRRRRLGSGLVVLGAMALPMTASISYASAQAQEPARAVKSVAPAPLALPDAPDAPPVPFAPIPPLPPMAPAAPEAAAPPLPPAAPQVPLHVRVQGREAAHVPDAQWHEEMEEFSREMNEWAEHYAEHMEGQALAWADAGRHVPQVVESCAAGDRHVGVTADGRPQIVLCHREIRANALASAVSGLRSAREAIARDSHLSERARRETLRALEDEIARIERERLAG